jgi:AAT family amino acid transporter
VSTARTPISLIFNVYPALTTVPWDYPNLSNKSATTSPFTIVFKQFGSSAFYPLLTPNIRIHFAVASASFMNTVILSSAISAGNHALFAGTRVLYGLAQASQAPSLFAWTTRGGVPLPALLLTSSFSVLCFGSSFIGSGQLWVWLQNLVGVSNQVRTAAVFNARPLSMPTPCFHPSIHPSIQLY